MKEVFGILLSAPLACTSCGDGSSEGEPLFKVYNEYSKEKKVEKRNDIGKTTYIFWTNKVEAKKLHGLIFSTKCRVMISKGGSIKTLGYEKGQPYTVIKGLEKYLKALRTGEKILKEGTVRTGGWVVFLCYAMLR